MKLTRCNPRNKLLIGRTDRLRGMQAIEHRATAGLVDSIVNAASFMKYLFGRRDSWHLKSLPVLVTLLLAISCASISRFDTQSFINATTLQSETHQLINMASEPYAQHKVEADSLWAHLRRAQAHSESIGKNKDVNALWNILLRADGTLDRFFDEWRVQPIEPQAYLDERVANIDSIFTTLVEAEQAKPKP